MRINQVVIMSKSQNRYAGTAAESDIVSALVDSIVEHLDYDRIRFSMHEKDPYIYPNSLILSVGVGFSNKPEKLSVNSTCFEFGKDFPKLLERSLTEYMSDWGKCCGHGHRVKQSVDKDADHLNKPDTIGFHIEPFIFNGPNSDDYQVRLDGLGKGLAHCIYEFMMSRNEIPAIQGQTITHQLS